MTIGRIDAFVNEICPLVIPIKMQGKRGFHMKRQMGLWACLALVPATLAGQTPPLRDGAEWERRCREGGGG